MIITDKNLMDKVSSLVSLLYYCKMRLLSLNRSSPCRKNGKRLFFIYCFFYTEYFNVCMYFVSDITLTNTLFLIEQRMIFKKCQIKYKNAVRIGNKQSNKQTNKQTKSNNIFYPCAEKLCATQLRFLMMAVLKRRQVVFCYLHSHLPRIMYTKRPSYND